jgi:chorismate dehydratase
MGDSFSNQRKLFSVIAKIQYLIFGSVKDIFSITFTLCNRNQDMDILKISAVSYLNTYPFVYGLLQSGIMHDFHLDLDVPSKCASKLLSGESDISLVPVGAIPDLKNFEMISGYCIGAVKKVKTVLLLSQKPLKEIHEICLDNDSRTSVQLVKVLARNYWKINPSWRKINPSQIDEDKEIEALVAIGDKTFSLVNKYRYCYDLAEEWVRFTSLPFVFAAWVTTKPLSEVIIHSLNNALEYGVMHIDETLEFFKDKLPENEDCSAYLKENISYTFDEKKKEGMKLFLDLLQQSCLMLAH